MATTSEHQEPTTVRKRLASPERRPGGDEDPDLECGICTELLNDARQAPCCGSLACCECLDAAASKSGTCPFCRETLAPGTGHCDVRMERRAANAVRRCPYDGCEFRDKRDALRLHIGGCDKRPSAEIIANLRAEIAALRSELAQKNARCAMDATKHRIELEGAQAALAANETFALKYAFSANSDGIHVASLRALGGRFALRFKWHSNADHVWSYGYKTGGGVSAKLRLCKGNRTFTLELVRNADDGDSESQRVEVVSPDGLNESEVVHIRVPSKKGYVCHARLNYSYDEFERLFVREGGFVVAVL